ncbi:MAG: RNA-binding S4 domain-containing protein [Gammaproteobacteria bacterium]|nr:RNA-binding S4 domain-containing protein [Gammaproteobacteria bacterium]
MEIFELEDHEFIELNNLLKVTGFCESGGLAKIMIGDGQVKVDGKVELRKRCKIRTHQVVEFNGQSVMIK